MTNTATDPATDLGTRTGSVYPVPVADLVPVVADRARQMGRWPSQNQVMTEYRVGVGKARQVLQTLRDSGFDPTGDTGAGGRGTANTDASVTSVGPVAGASTGAALVGDSPEAPVLGAVLGAVDGQVGQHGAPVPAPAAEPASTPVPAAGEAAGAAAAGVAGVAAGDATHRVAALPGAVPGAPVVRSVSGRRWQVLSLVLLSLPAFVAIWGGWVGLGRMTGFGDVELLPGIADGWTIDSAITLPIGVETYAAFALRVWLSREMTANRQARRFAMWSAFAALVLGMTGQVAYHLMTAAGITVAPWPITTVVACLPVAVLGSGAALAHLMHTGENHR